LPSPRPGLPGAGEVDLRAFWPRFDDVAPLHVRLAFRAAVLAVGVVLPRALGHRGALADLDVDARDAVIARAASVPGVVELLEVAKVVACMAYFADDGVQRAFRGAP
jgi:hypothetical protein